jgi:hypothetical protein
LLESALVFEAFVQAMDRNEVGSYILGVRGSRGAGNQQEQTQSQGSLLDKNCRDDVSDS